MVQVIPRVYPGGGPLYWADEQSGELSEALEAYYAHSPANPATAAQLALLIDYCDYWVNAPCWRGDEIEVLKASIKSVCTAEELKGWLIMAELYGVDPL